MSDNEQVVLVEERQNPFRVRVKGMRPFDGEIHELVPGFPRERDFIIDRCSGVVHETDFHGLFTPGDRHRERP
jgi:hypothetical protein